MKTRFRKSDNGNLETELNLAPFLDILSVCICFLLTTAVWLSVSAIPLSGSGSGKGSGNMQSCLLTVNVISSKQLVIDRSKSSVKKWTALRAIDSRELKQKLTRLLQEYQPGEGACATIRVGKEASYGDLISVADTLRHFGYRGLSVSSMNQEVES